MCGLGGFLGRQDFFYIIYISPLEPYSRDPPCQMDLYIETLRNTVVFNIIHHTNKKGKCLLSFILLLLNDQVNLLHILSRLKVD